MQLARQSNYPTDLTEAEWQVVRPFIPASRPVGADRKTPMRAVVDAIFYRRRSGCPWRMLPHDFPHWRTVYGYFRQWQQDGTWARIENARAQHPMRAAAARRGGRAAGAARRPLEPASSGQLH